MTHEPHGATIWYFPDGELPPHGGSEPHGHESLLILNAGQADASVQITFYFTDRSPDHLDSFTVEGQRVRCIRLDEPISDYRVPHGQYALRVQTSVPVICQIGRMDVRQANLAYYTVMGWTPGV